MNSTFYPNPLTHDEICTAHLESARTNVAGNLYGPELWLLRQIETATHSRLHLSDALRELREEFRSLTSAWAVVSELVHSTPAGVTLVWRRDLDNRLTYFGARPSLRPYPQRPKPLGWQPGTSCWYEPTAQEAAEWSALCDPISVLE